MRWTSHRTNTAIEGIVKVGKSTKQLLHHIEPKQIIVIQHKDIDDMAATGIIQAKVKAVINADESMSGQIPIKGAKRLLDAKIPIFEVKAACFEQFCNGLHVQISGGSIALSNGKRIPCKRFTEADWKVKQQCAEANLGQQLNDFIDNTLYYAGKEKDFVIKPLSFPSLMTKIKHKHVVVVVRGSGYKHDLLAIREYIEDYQPVLIGVDGGADAILEAGFRPHLIVGDMDSISDEALLSGAEILVHAYLNGDAPGMKRVESLNLKAKTIRAQGTSEDIAMLLAYEHEAELIVTLGAHSHMTDFLQKGRKGMGSTMLVRMKIGAKLIDAKGVSKLYTRPLKWRNYFIVPAAACFPLAMLGLIHPGFRQVMDMLWLYVKLTFTS